MKKTSLVYLAVVGSAFAAMALVFDLFPRTKFSEIERRDLAEFPEFSMGKLFSGQFTDSISKWFSDTEPFRESFLTFNDKITKWKGMHLFSGKKSVTLVVSESSTQTQDADTVEIAEDVPLEEIKDDEKNTENYKIPNSGIILIGEEPNVRVILAFGCTKAYCHYYSEVANKYKETFPDVNIWVMPIPSASEFYCPEEAKSISHSQVPVLREIEKHLNPNVNFVWIRDTLAAHVDEDIYLRTDHHWSPLGGYYAAKVFASQAGLPFKTLQEGYERRVVHGFVGTMAGYSGDISVRHSPEDFVWYYPTKTNFRTLYRVYDIDKEYKIVGEHNEYEGSYFCKFKDGSSGAYCTFMGSDARITRVLTDTKNGRRLIIIKDSYGNTLPSCLFYSFEEVHVIDYRYFKKNMQQYVTENKITDILFANNLVFCTTPSTAKNYSRFLTQSGNFVYEAKEVDSTLNEQVADSVKVSHEQKNESNKTEEPKIELESSEKNEPASQDSVIAIPDEPKNEDSITETQETDSLSN